MSLGNLDLGDTFWQILGTAGFMETIFELVYVSSQRSVFTKFEEFFFIYTASWELLGEVLALLALWGMFVSDESSEDNGEGGEAEKDGQQEGFRRWDMAKVLLRDPIHNLAHPVDLTRKDGEGSRPPGTLKRLYDQHPKLESYFVLAWVGVALPGFSIVIWAVFLPMWGMFDGEDYDLRLWICISFWIWITALPSLCFKCKDFNSGFILFVVTAYALNKSVEMYLLFSRGDRLADGFIGQGLRYLQIAELGSVAIIVYRTLFTDVYTDTPEPTTEGNAEA